jgi:hypothetical protein
MTDPAALDVLRRIRQAPPVPIGESCEMCGAPVGDDHSHVVDLARRALLCTCRPCALLFDYPDARLAYKTVPDRYRALDPLPLPVWEDLQVPVGVAFFFVNSELDRVVGVYPSPAGATESELPLGAWDAVLAAAPALSTLVPDVEAAYVVPFEVCHELVGELRRRWRGFDGGQDARQALDRFFDRVAGRCR